MRLFWWAGCRYALTARTRRQAQQPLARQGTRVRASTGPGLQATESERLQCEREHTRPYQASQAVRERKRYPRMPGAAGHSPWHSPYWRPRAAALTLGAGTRRGGGAAGLGAPLEGPAWSLRGYAARVGHAIVFIVHCSTLNDNEARGGASQLRGSCPGCSGVGWSGSAPEAASGAGKAAGRCLRATSSHAVPNPRNSWHTDWAYLTLKPEWVLLQGGIAKVRGSRRPAGPAT